VEGPSRYRGFDGVREFLRDRLAIFMLSDVEVEEWIAAGDEVIAVLHFRTRGRQSGVPLDFRQAHVWTVKDSKLTRLRIYQSKAEALEGIRPSGSPSTRGRDDVLDHPDE
jgi:ketosteroid isomerase-like protein